jgi:hypothetical protein
MKTFAGFLRLGGWLCLVAAAWTFGGMTGGLIALGVVMLFFGEQWS